MEADEVRAEKHKVMGPELGEMHVLLSAELADLWIHWKDLLELFAKSQENLDIVNEAAGAFFGRLEFLMWSETMLHLCRITDPPETFGHENLTVNALPSRIVDDALRAQVDAALVVVKEKTEFARNWRNKRLAHLQLPPLDGSPSTPLSVASRTNVDEALKALAVVMNMVEVRYRDGSTAYDGSVEVGRTARFVVHYLKLGLAAEREYVAARKAARKAAEAQNEGGGGTAT